MKDIHKNPIFYFIVIPAIIGLWPLLLWTVYLPRAQSNWEIEKKRYTKTQKIIDQILTVDPDRLDFAKGRRASAEFNYATAIDQVANQYKIPSANYNISTKPVRISKGQKTQNCQVILKQIDIAKFANFLSTIQIRWANLQCEKLTMARKKGLKNTWKVDLGFKYYY